MKQLHLHLLSDSTGETLDMLAKACLAQFDDVEAIPHLWPMVRSEGHLERVLDDVERRPEAPVAPLIKAASTPPLNSGKALLTNTLLWVPSVQKSSRSSLAVPEVGKANSPKPEPV